MQQKITARSAAKFLADEPKPGAELHDTDLPGFHLRAGSRGASFRVRYRNDAGQRRAFTVGRYGAVTAEQARQEARARLGEVAAGRDPSAMREAAKLDARRQQAQTLGAYLEGPYGAYLARRKSGDQTKRMIKGHFGQWLSRPMQSLKKSELLAWQADKEADGLQYPTISRAWDALRAMLNHAASDGLIDANPLAGVKLQKPALTEQELASAGTARRDLLDEELSLLFKGLEGYQKKKREQRRNSRAHGRAYLADLDAVPYADHVAPWVLTMFYTGFRPGDLFGLRWEHVNLRFKTIRKVIEKTAHHNPQPTLFPISSALAKVLADWWKQCGKPGEGYVFPSERTGGWLDKSAMRKPWAAIKKAGGLPDALELYSLRHNFASRLVMDGVDLLTVSKLMGHTDIQTTIQHYAHLQPNRSRDVVDAFASASTPVAESSDPDFPVVSPVSPVSSDANGS